MNLFENLQLMKESDTSIVSEFKEFLSSKNAQYIANEIGETKDGMQIVIYDGDWKHEHLYMKHLLDEFFTGKGMDISITSEEIGESDQDTFSARYDITFNVKSKEYSADIKPLKFTTQTEGTSYKRIASTSEFDNGHVIFNDWKKMSDEEAEELAKQKSIENPNKIFYVKYDDVMNPCSDIKWKNGEIITESNDCTNIIPIEYSYDGDEISDYKGYIRICADTEEEALSAAEKWINSTHSEINPRHFVVSKDNYTNTNIIDVNGNELKESNHNEILDKDYATGEKIYNELEKYLNSLDQIAMDGKDCNWEPSEFNAKNLNADGEIYLECGAYILIYPYINEWAEDYFKVFVVEASDLSLQLKNGIEDIFNKYKNDKWRLVFEG